MGGTAPLPESARERAVKRVARQRAEQRWLLGAGGAVAGAAAGAAFWTWFAVQLQADWGGAALAVGALAGLATRWFGRATSRWFGLWAAVCAVAGCLVGQGVANAILLAQHGAVQSAWAMLRHPVSLVDGVRARFDALHVCLYAIAAAEAYWLAWERVRAPRV